MNTKVRSRAVTAGSRARRSLYVAGSEIRPIADLPPAADGDLKTHFIPGGTYDAARFPGLEELKRQIKLQTSAT